MKNKNRKSTPAEKAEKAFAESDRHKFGDLKLEPWTPDRIIQAQLLGMVYPNTGKQGWEQLTQTGVYPGAVRDTILFIYLSTLPENEVADGTWKDAKAFGVKHGLHNPDSAAFWKAYPIFMKAQSEIESSTTIPKGLANADEDGAYEEDPKD